MHIRESIITNDITVIDDASKCWLVEIRESDHGGQIIRARTVVEGQAVWLTASALYAQICHYQEMMKVIRYVQSKYNL